MSTRASDGPLVLVVEDEPQVRRFLRTSLQAHGYRLLEAMSGAEGIRMASQYVPEIVLLDLGLPDVDGLEVTILVLSARGQESAKVDALDAGADDYLTKPFGFAELLARLRVALRHSRRAAPGPDEPDFECGPLRLQYEARRVFLGDTEVHLTPIEYKLLTTLARHSGRVVTHKQLLQEVWGPQNTQDNQYLRVYMTHLRRKLDPPDSSSRIFKTEVGVGYRLECP
jgi:two-component system, OmpR family, KDP operon response regulator KdpE